jgi:hypothetical protein
VKWCAVEGDVEGAEVEEALCIRANLPLGDRPYDMLPIAELVSDARLQ